MMHGTTKIKKQKKLNRKEQNCKVSQLVLISNFSRVLNVVCFLLGNSLASEFYMPTFRNTVFHLHRQVGVNIPAYEDGTDSVPKSRHRKFRGLGITQKKAYVFLFIYTSHTSPPQTTPALIHSALVYLQVFVFCSLSIHLA